MHTRAIKRRYSGSALEAWLQRLDGNWEQYFEKAALQGGQQLYREGAVREIELSEEDAIIHVSSELAEGYAVIEWNGSGPSVRSSKEEEAFGKMLATAGIYEIEELVADEAAPLTPEPRKKREPNLENGNNHSALDSVSSKNTSKKSDHQDKQETLETSRKLLVSFYVSPRGLGFSAYLVDSEQKRVPALGQGCKAAGELSNGEREALIRLASAARRSGFRYASDADRYWMETLDATPRFVRNELPKWKQHFAIETPDDVKQLIHGVREAKLIARATLKSGHLGIDWLVDIDGQKLNTQQTRKLVANGGNTIFLPKRGLAHLDRGAADTAKAWRELNTLFPEGNFPNYLAFSLFSTDEVKIELDDAVRAWRDRLMKPEKNGLAPPLDVLRDYQEHGVRWMHHLARHNCHGLLADEMGLGKTLQVLSLIEASKTVDRPSLVVCPASVIPVWKSEAAHFFPGMKVEVLGKNNLFAAEQVDLWVASYTQLRRNKQLLADRDFYFVVLDEAQFIKNPDAKVTQACLSIRAEHRIALTGTPVENRLLDAWTIYRFLMPGLLGSRRRFEATVTAEPEDTLKRLRKQIAPFVLRRTKAEVARELPEKIHTEIVCPMSGPQRAEYDRLAREGLKQYGQNVAAAKRAHGMNFLSLLTRLRQTCCDPGLLPWVKQTWESSGKITLLLDRLEEVFASGRRAVVFSQFVRLLDRTRAATHTRFPDVNSLILTGGSRNRAQPVKDFQQLKDAGVIFVSLRAGGTGITLTNADYVFLLDPWWNPAVEEQAIDRVHRIGRTDPVFVYRMVAENSIEQKIQQLQTDKRELLQQTMGDASGGSDFTDYQGTLSELLSVLPADAAAK